MSFTTNCCLLKATPEIIDKLKQLGYIIMKSTEGAKYIRTTCGCVVGRHYIPTSLFCKHVIYCGTNENLFLAVASLRDDTDDKQWFIMDVEIYSDISKGTWFKSSEKTHTQVGIQIDPLYCHKATVKELIEHFK